MSAEPSGVLPADTEKATSSETRAELLRLSGSGYAKVRHLLCQLPSSVGNDRRGVLGSLVHERKRRPLQLYLLLLTVWPMLKNRNEPLPAEVWARALSTARGRRWSTTNVSAAWGDLEGRGLVARRRASRGVFVTPRREDGQAEYVSPGAKRGDHFDSYFVLPGEFWTDEWFEKLTMPGIAMLLIVLSRTNDADQRTWLTNNDAGAWYGLSPRTVEGGLADLAKHGLLEESVEWVKAPLSRIGTTKRHFYQLMDPFSSTARRRIQDHAKAERSRRLGPDAAAAVVSGVSEPMPREKV